MVIGKGAYGTVIKAYANQDLKRKHPYAIKIIDKTRLLPEDF